MNVLDLIRRGRVNADLLPQIFDESEEVPEEYRLKAVAQVMRTNPQASRVYFKKLDVEKLSEAIETNRMDPEMIVLAIRLFPDEDRLQNVAIASPKTPTQALLILASSANERQLGQLLRDETRLILAPDLISALLAREELDDLFRQRLEDIQLKIKRDSQYQIRAGFRPENLSSDDKKLLIEEEREGEERPRQSIYAKLMVMTAAEKAMLAVHANRTTRLLLVKDPNKMVSRAVMRSPRLSDQDIESISQMREVDEEILRLISQNRRWMRKYLIIKNLALNPRSPVPIALGLVERLINNDIKIALRDHNIPNAVKQAIKRVARKRGLN